MRILGILTLLSGPALAAGCPQLPDYSPELRNLIEQADRAPDVRAGRVVSDAMWKVWLRAPDEVAQGILDTGLRRRDAYDFLGAIGEFDRLVTYCPDYAEGYNQRAYIHFLNGEYAAALTNLDMALNLQPLHVAAQTGRALTLMHMGRISEARAQLLIAVENNPWLPEAGLLAKDAPLGPQGSDI
ncbi:tetratricopeptide repeat protein [Sulfitobacter sp.]|uniref:tetratricopeptide repeat protein n=1 Tax=Sulfitobacter sp. TaxID=1903071 RepID=UPI000C0E6549|nr:hypothetical protein [Roseobacter sp.]MBV48056.1 hypothetical protein [Roseobacter sp.]PHR00996.1 MAG: hypothetical protein COB29_15195 [Sulfitobacter sp.]|tara:strand:+ start:1024 stop:1578 length:555 start_codon:yes stop_codon:yes gene_type:complete